MNMEKLISFSDWLWSGPLIAIILIGGIYISFRLKFLQFFKLPLIIKGIKKDAKGGNNGEGNISPLQTAFTAIGSTLGAGNIMGMAIAVSMGGLGAIFWMMIFGIFALLLKYSEVVLAIKHREKNMFGDFVGGPAYYLKKTALPILGAAYALTHAIEGYITKGAHVISDMFEVQAIELIAKHLRGAVKDKNIVDMEGMSIGQYVAGMGFSNVGLGIVHSMAHPLGGVYDIAHGVANALLLPIVMEYNMPVCIDKYGNIAKAMGVDITNMSKEEAAKAAIDAVRQLAIDVNIPQTLRELNIPKEGLPRLAKDALADVCTGGNPREVTYEDILKLYEIAY